MDFEIEYADSGINCRITEELSAPDWRKAEKKAEKRLADLVAEGRLHERHAYVAAMRSI